MILCSDRIGNFLSKIPFQFCMLLYRVFDLQIFFRWKFFTRETKKKIPLYDSRQIFTDYKYSLPLILSINRKKEKKKKEEAIYSSSKSGERKSKTYYSIYDHEVHLFSSTPPLPSFETRTISLPPCFRAFYFIPRLPPPSFSSRKSVFRPLTSIKPKACCIQIFISRGEIARPFWSRQLSKSSRIVCEALYRPAKALAPSLSYRTPSTPSRSLTHPFPPPSREFELSKRRKTRGWIRRRTLWTSWRWEWFRRFWWYIF